MASLIIKYIYIGCLLILTLGCAKESDTKILTANRKIDVYKSFTDDQQQIIFNLNPGDKCTVGRRKVAKIYAYYEITCPSKGTGWVVIGDGYEIIEKKDSK